MSKDIIKVNMNVYDIPIVVEQLKKLEQENKQLEDLLHKANDEVISYTNCCIDLKGKINKAIEYIKQYNLDGVKLNSDYWYDCLIELLEILGDKENENNNN